MCLDVDVRDLAFAGAAEQARMLAEGTITAPALLEVYLDRIVRLDPEGRYGFIATADSRETYFHRNCVVDAEFDQLRVGDEVRFAEGLGEKGPQASTVHLVGTPFTLKKRG